MELRLACICDCANVTASGKLNVMGEFDTLHGPGFPLVHPVIFFAAKVGISIGDPDQMRFELRVLDEDRRLVVPPHAIAVRRTRLPGPDQEGELSNLRIVIQVTNAEFPRPGKYEFELTAQGNIVGSVGMVAKVIP